MRISVIIPVYNGEAFLADAIESAIGQTLVPCEVIVVDDGSTDGSAGVASAFGGVTVISQANLGLPGARNTGIRVARGDAIALLDADDVWLPSKLAEQAEAMRAGERSMVTSRHIHVVEPGVTVPPAVASIMGRDDQTGSIPSSWFVRRGTFERVGLFDESVRFGEDVEWLTRAHDVGVVEHLLDEKLLLRRIHGSNLTLLHPAEFQAKMMSLLRASVRRKREQSGGV